ncbi:MAG: glycosyltransferase family 4 protein [Desulfocapsaceae bacterium]|nr:glycosyltransferase family 4 protein [Desulfocapsaceae bacterium]
MLHNRPFVIVTGTDPESRRGGIGFAMPGYLSAMACVGMRYISIPTYHPSAKGGAWWWWLRSFWSLCWHLVTIKRAGARVVVYSHAGAGISLLREGVVLAFCRLFGAKTIMQLHALEIDGYLGHAVKRFLFRVAIAPASAVAVLTPWWRERLTESGIIKSLFVIPNPMPESWEAKACSCLAGHKAGRDGLAVLTLARIEPGKGVDLVIESMPFLPESTRLVIAGDGSQLQMLKMRAQTIGVNRRVEFVGWVAGDEKQRLIDEADIFCLPSSYDSFGMGFLEAMANGLPVVALDWGPIADVVPNGRCGVLIREKNAGELADALRLLMDSDIRQKMCVESRRWVLENFSAQAVGVKIRSMMEEVSP